MTMSHVLARISSPRWLGNRVMTTARNFAELFTPFTPTVIERQVAGELCQFYLGNVVENVGMAGRLMPAKKCAS